MIWGKFQEEEYLWLVLRLLPLQKYAEQCLGDVGSQSHGPLTSPPKFEVQSGKAVVQFLLKELFFRSS